ncbi:uncharacterized protein LOC119672810 [Teleopsis dalmanni]|uniref:uncharacterized protein LOC119672810 n=1 Tax=Teleopsis dalmanni TaxID=139649 RepID=UPI0018CE42AE|nr:uncharacterized protein LOC119672810 [Teleopsis dalmanni]
MWSLFLITLLFSNQVFSARMLSSSSQRITTRETKSCESRQTPGPICESCELLSTCVNHSSGWVNIPVESCDTQNGFYCNARLSMCSNITGPCHPFGSQNNFPCTTQGIFPDPYDCQKFHMCYFVESALVAANVECGGDKAFNAATGQCSLTIQDEICQKEQFECEKSGDAHAWPSNPNIFYICKATSNQNSEQLFYPTLYRCADGEIFDGYYCRVMRPIEPTTTTTTTTTSTISTSGVSTTVTTPSTLPRTCTNVGLTADPDDCHKYFYCSAVNGEKRHMECPRGTYYNPQLVSCTIGNC